GVPLWTNLYNGPGNGRDDATAIAAGGNGTVGVTGTSVGTGGGFFHYDYATVAYSSNGIALWTNIYNGPGNSEDFAVGVAVDSGGNVFVTGSSKATNGYNDFATVAYSSGGVPLWTNLYNGAIDNNTGAHAIAVDGTGNVFVTGASAGLNGYLDYA